MLFHSWIMVPIPLAMSPGMEQVWVRVFVCVRVCAQSCPTLYDLVECSPSWNVDKDKPYPASK